MNGDILNDTETAELAELTSKIYKQIDFKYYPYAVADLAVDITDKCKKIKEHYE